jgi:cyclic-di-GMP-binding protein
MAESSFDIEAGVERQEVDNAINQAAREAQTRFDFKDTDTVIEWSGEEGIRSSPPPRTGEGRARGAA